MQPGPRDLDHSAAADHHEPEGAAPSFAHPIRESPGQRPSELVNSRETGFEAFYCIPGVEGAHEKGGVEGEIGRFRRGFLVPVPRVTSLVRWPRTFTGC